MSQRQRELLSSTRRTTAIPTLHRILSQHGRRSCDCWRPFHLLTYPVRPLALSLAAYSNAGPTLAMHPKPLLALMTMCRNPGSYVGQRLDTGAKFYMASVSKAIQGYLKPSEGTGGKGSESMDRFIQRGKRQSITWDATHHGL